MTCELPPQQRETECSIEQNGSPRLSKKIKEDQVVTANDIESEPEDMNDEDDIEEYACEDDNAHLIDIRQAVLDKIGVSHPITFDVYNLCTFNPRKKGIYIQGQDAKGNLHPL
jgi:hypothetical protein